LFHKISKSTICVYNHAVTEKQEKEKSAEMRERKMKDEFLLEQRHPKK
jgi:hypothetical protein